ncbi:hypothetical protein ASG43_03415 [Aureimonas sp. Leaf454]|uniref:hypothetical protein n=1 Tax=Aureimonas sp. Leaf454 TaxID=1736381 RepID=UPI00070036EB|nr:hypothetical protein [Aureimonas sp. Leaf454]KQT54649.1 hypothetical protein ASG43_03415 [Aureimonas sp. Leaf454]
MSDTDHGATAPPTKLIPAPAPSGRAPAHAFAPKSSVVDERGTHVCVSREALFDLLDGVKKLAPCHKDPNRYHERKDDIVSRLFDMATA